MRSLIRQCCAGVLATAAVFTLLSASPVQAKAPAGRYTIANGEVTDTKTGLVWRQTVNAGYFNHAGALAHCTQLGGGWRAPNVRELYSLVDSAERDPAIDADAFPDTPAGEMWTSTQQAEDTTQAWAVDFYDGGIHWSAKTTEHRVRCVR
jgi:hypothetical protein